MIDPIISEWYHKIKSKEEKDERTVYKLLSIIQTLQFSLIPVGKTKDNFNKKLLLERDKQRAENYEKVKGYIDRFHKEYIESVLVNARGEKIDEYADLYWKSNKDDSDAKAMESLENDMRKQISKRLKSNARYKRLFGKELICEDLPSF